MIIGDMSRKLRAVPLGVPLAVLSAGTGLSLLAGSCTAYAVLAVLDCPSIDRLMEGIRQRLVPVSGIAQAAAVPGQAAGQVAAPAYRQQL